MSGARRAAAAGTPHVLMLSAAHPPTDLRIVGKEGAALAAAGWRVTHLAPAPRQGARDVPAVHAGVAIATYPRASGWIGRLRAARALAERAARLRPDVIHAHEPDSWYAAVLAGGRTGAGVVLDVHEHYPSRLDGRLPGPFRGLGRRAVRAACRWMGARADAVVVAKDGLEDAFPGVEVTPVRNYAAAVPVEPRAHRDGPPTLVHLGALTRERGAIEMLRALAACPEGTRLSLIGRFTDGSEADFLAEAGRLGVADRVERHGWVAHEEAVRLAAGAEIGLVLFQPGHENHRLALPHKLFDCMLAGLPVIVPDFAEEVAAVVREAGCGVLVDTAEPEAIAGAVRALLDPQVRARMGAAGRAAALGRFGWEGEAARLVALYRELAPLPPGTRPDGPAPTPPRPAPGPVPDAPLLESPVLDTPMRSAPVPASPATPRVAAGGVFSLLDEARAVMAAPPVPARPPLAGRSNAVPEAVGSRLLEEAGLADGGVPPSVAPVLSRRAGGSAGAPAPAEAAAPPAEWRLLRPPVLPSGAGPAPRADR